MKTKRIGVIVGDPNGVGPEVAIKAALSTMQKHRVQPILLGDDYLLMRTVERLEIPDERVKKLIIHHVPALDEADWRPGEISAAAGSATVRYVKAAVEGCLAKEFTAIAAGPHSETAVNLSEWMLKRS